MPTDAKRQMVAELTELLSQSPSAIVTDYRGLTVSDIAAVRRALREQGISYRVIKNRLGRIAADQAGLTELAPLLEGPSALAVGQVDEVVLAKSFLDAVRPYRTVTVRGGVLRGRRIESAAVDRLATLPSRDVLLGQLAGGMVAPLSGMASLLSAPLRNLAYALQQLAAQKGEGGGAAGSEPAPTPVPAGGADAATPTAAPAAPAATAAPDSEASTTAARATAESDGTTVATAATAEPAADATDATEAAPAEAVSEAPAGADGDTTEASTDKEGGEAAP